MAHPHIHTKFWIQELHDFGVLKGPNNEPLEELDYYDLRALLLQQKLRMNLEPKSTPWFP